MRNMRKSIIATFIATAFLSLNAGASDLLQIYKEALTNDSSFNSARASKLAGQERFSQSKVGAVLPQISAWADVSVGQTRVDPRIGSSFTRNDHVNSLNFSLSQNLFNRASWETFEQSKLSLVQSDIFFAQSQQDLMLRVSQAYFDVLAAQNTLRTLESQKVATAEQLASAKRNFEVGTQTITDTHEAQSSYDLITAQVFAGQGDLEVKQAALRQIIGRDAGDLAILKDGVQINAPFPEKMNDWVTSAESQNFSVTSSQISMEIAQREIKKSRAVYLPTLSAGVNANRSPIKTADANTATIGLTLRVPLYTGLSTDSRIRESIALEDRARNDLETARRAAAQSARQSYIGVVNGLAQIKAFEAALISSQSALDSTKLGYQVGVRINIDVLNAQQKLSNTRQSLARARYDSILSGLRLKAAAGSLKESDLAEVNALLAQ
jgi:outer membrane protein